MKKEIIFLIILILVTVSAFYGGMKYQQSKIPQRTFFQRGGWQTTQLRERMLSGEVISKDEKSLTLKLPDNSTRIVFLSDSTKILKTTEGTVNDIEVGTKVAIIGNQITEGTFFADQIQLSPLNFRR